MPSRPDPGAIMHPKRLLGLTLGQQTFFLGFAAYTGCITLLGWPNPACGPGFAKVTAYVGELPFTGHFYPRDDPFSGLLQIRSRDCDIPFSGMPFAQGSCTLLRRLPPCGKVFWRLLRLLLVDPPRGAESCRAGRPSEDVWTVLRCPAVRG